MKRICRGVELNELLSAALRGDFVSWPLLSPTSNDFPLSFDRTQVWSLEKSRLELKGIFSQQLSNNFI